MKKLIYLIILVIIASFFIIGCTEQEVVDDKIKSQPESKCIPKTCHHNNPATSCVSLEEPLVCTTDLQPTDYCGKFVSCDENCQIVEKPEYRECIECFKGCNLWEEDCPQSSDCFGKFPEIKEAFFNN